MGLAVAISHFGVELGSGWLGKRIRKFSRSQLLDRRAHLVVRKWIIKRGSVSLLLKSAGRLHR
jgi:hypothetical protein